MVNLYNPDRTSAFKRITQGNIRRDQSKVSYSVTGDQSELVIRQMWPILQNHAFSYVFNTFTLYQIPFSPDLAFVILENRKLGQNMRNKHRLTFWTILSQFKLKISNV